MFIYHFWKQFYSFCTFVGRRHDYSFKYREIPTIFQGGSPETIQDKQSENLVMVLRNLNTFENDCIRISQSDFVGNVIEEFSMNDAHPRKLPWDLHRIFFYFDMSLFKYGPSVFGRWKILSESWRRNKTRTLFSSLFRLIWHLTVFRLYRDIVGSLIYIMTCTLYASIFVIRDH